MIQFEIDFPPATGNTQYHVIARRKRLKPKVKDYRDEVALTISAYDLPEPPYSMSLLIIPPDHRTRDSDNHLKVIMDAIKPAIGDDSWHVVPMLQVAWWPFEETEDDESRVQVTIASCTMEPLVDAYRAKYQLPDPASTG